MKVERKTGLAHKKLLFLILTGILLLILVGWLYFAHHFQTWPFSPSASTANQPNTINYNPATPNQSSAGNAIKSQSADQSNNTTGSSSSTSAAPNPASQATVTFTALNVNGSNLLVRVVIDKVTNSGTCALSLVGPNGKTYSSAAGVQALASNSTCQGFNVPLSALSSGHWTADVKYSDPTNAGEASRGVDI